ncbi:hypothetical protein JD844_026055 [Phrynosoma platyrhinos]|uniref:C-type lectin domain-containing protein n=1 Tax=Phrynosoma platyrhinos TaxID=52577 RepID=A0ABQ7SEF4_PHRPL|nr:hypothetical protein JD844_026055 [Phrynosoma platyrhinos]
MMSSSKRTYKTLTLAEKIAVIKELPLLEVVVCIPDTPERFIVQRRNGNNGITEERGVYKKKRVFWQKKKPFLETRQGEITVRVSAVVFFILAVVMFTLYFEVLALAQNLSDEMVSVATENEDVQAEIDKIAKTLSQWTAYNKNLYYFSKDVQSWKDAIAICIQKESNLVSVRWGEEQGYLDQEAHRLKSDFWIGLQRNSSAINGWSWLAEFPTYVVTEFVFQDNNNNSNNKNQGYLLQLKKVAHVSDFIDGAYSYWQVISETVDNEI